MKKLFAIHHHPKREAAFVALVVFLITIVCNVSITWISKGALIQGLQHHLLSISSTASQLTDGDLHQTLTSPDKTGSDEYSKLLATYHKMIAADPEIRFIYTVVSIDGKPHFILDSQYGEVARPEEENQSAPAEIMEPYDEASEGLIAALNEKRAVAENDLYSDKWGTFLSAYAPLYDSQNQFIGVVGVDMDASDYSQNLMRVYIAFTIGMTLSLILSSIVYLIAYRIRSQHLKEHDVRGYRVTLMEHFNKDVETISVALSSASDTIHGMAGTMMQMAHETSVQTKDVSTQINGSASRVQSIGTVCGQLLQSAYDLEQNAQESRAISTTANEKVQLMGEASSQLNVAATNISAIINMIVDITERIDLLSLNATIEAARAGAAGKSFAVVAEEVKSLSKQTADATRKIIDFVQEVQKTTGTVASVYSDMSGTVTAVLNQTEKAVSIVSSQKELLQMIHEDIDGVSKSTEVAENGVKFIHKIATDTDIQTQSLYTSVARLTKQNADLKQHVSNFLEYM